MTNPLFLRDIEAAARHRPPLMATLSLGLITLILVTALVWAHYAVLDVVTHAEGKVIPSRQIQIVQNLEGGILAELLVAEGDSVAKGQVLARMDGTSFASEAETYRARRLALLASATRLSAEAEGGALLLPAEIPAEIAQREQRLYGSRKQEQDSTQQILASQLTQRRGELAQLDGRAHALERSQDLLQQELVMARGLAEQGLKSRAELLRLERQMSDLQAEADNTQAKLPSARAAMEEIRRRMVERVQAFRSAAMQDLSRTKADIAAIEGASVAMTDRVNRRDIRAPMDGIVKRIAMTTLGGVLQPGTEVLEIVPVDASLLVEARVKPAEIAFLHPGQAASIRLTAYDSTIYGSLAARLEHISADTMTDRNGESFYLVRLRTEAPRDGGHKLDILPGMVATADILTAKQSVLNYLLKPIRKASQTALRER